jgi:hypothetical protein
MASINFPRKSLPRTFTGKRWLSETGFPSTIRVEAAARDDAVQVRMKFELAGPGVQHGRDAGLCPEALVVAGEFEKRLAHRVEEQVVEGARVRPGQRTQFGGHREDHVEMLGREDALLPRLDPHGLLRRMALRAVAITARVVGRLREAARPADVEVPAEHRRPAGLDVAHHLALLAGRRVSLPPGLAVGAEDVRNLELRPCGGRACR